MDAEPVAVAGEVLDGKSGTKDITVEQAAGRKALVEKPGRLVHLRVPEWLYRLARAVSFGRLGGTVNHSDERSKSTVTGSNLVDLPSGPLPRRHDIMTMLVASAYIFLGVAVVITVGLYVLFAGGTSAETSRLPDWMVDWGSVIAPTVGSGVALAAGLLYARHCRDTPERLDPQSYGELCESLAALDGQLSAFCPPNLIKDERAYACDQARLHNTEARRGWELGIGSYTVWRHLHGAQEALFIAMPRWEVVAAASDDVLRLEGSAIASRDALLEKLKQALRMLDLNTLGSPNAAASAEESRQAALIVDAEIENQARALLRDVRRAIYRFRDDNQAGLVRARDRLAWAGAVTYLMAYALLVLAVLPGTEWETLVTAVAFFLVGATVGVFNQLRRASADDSAAQDFGFSRTRLVYAPILSGVAAVGGVLVVSLVSAASGTINSDQGAFVRDLFNIDRNPLGLIVAAAFGLAPDRLIEGLQARADRYRDDLASTSTRGAEEKPSR